MALIIVTGGTVGATDGVPVTTGTRTNPLTFVNLDATLSAHIRCDEDQESDSTKFNVPTHCSAMFYTGATWTGWYTSASNPVDGSNIGPVNVPVRFKQTEVSSTAAGTFSTLGNYGSIAASGVYDGLTTPTISGALTTASVTATSVYLNWANGADTLVGDGAGGTTTAVVAGPGVTGYDVQYDTSSGYASASSITDPTISYAYVGGLGAGTLYYFRARAYDKYGNTSSWLTATDTTLGDTYLDDVTGFSALTTSATHIYLGWNAVTNRNHYQVDYSTNETYNLTATSSITGTGFTLGGLSSSTEYHFRIKAHGIGKYLDSQNYVTASDTTTSSEATLADSCTATLDNTTWISSVTRSIQGQCFTPGASGTLHAAQFYLKQGSPQSSAPVKCSLYAFDEVYTYGTNGIPTGSVIASTVINGTVLTGAYAWVNFPFDDTVSLTATHYCIAVNLTATAWNGDPYAVEYYSNYAGTSHGGNGFYWNGSSWVAETPDCGFKVYVMGA